MKKGKKDEEIECRFIDNYKKIENLYNLVKKTTTKADNNAYKDMVNIITKYYTKELDNSLKIILTNNVFKDYYKLSSRIIKKISYYENKKTYDIYQYINLYTESILNYKISIFYELKSQGFIEEKNLFSNLVYNPYKKLLQVLSIIYKDNYLKNPKELYENSKSSKIQNKGKKIVRKIIELNKQFYLVSQEYLIKPTNNIMEATYFISDIVVDNENDFKQVINFLYQLFWENNTIRALAKNKELDFINNLRRYFYHDLDHGTSSDFKKKVKLVKDFYISSIGKIPKTAKDWQNVQENMYILILDFLNTIVIAELELIK